MFSQGFEEHHEGNAKGKPRLPQSQGGEVSVNSTVKGCGGINASSAVSTLRLTNTKLNRNESADSITISRDLDVSIEVANVRDYHRIAKTLLIAFEEDPFTNYILNTETKLDPLSKKGKRKKDLMLAFYECQVLECFHLGGMIIVMKDNSLESDLALNHIKSKNLPYLGVACWNKLEFDQSSFVYDYTESLGVLDNIRPSFLKLSVFSALAKCRLRLKEKLPYLAEVRDKVLGDTKLNPTGDTVWYLSDVGLLPSMRGKGLAKILINHFINKYVDQVPNSWCYLENSNPNNRTFYGKLGFKVATTFAINNADELPTGESICLDAMIKHPRYKFSLNFQAVEFLEQPLTTIQGIAS
ncbi:uncharacterized protein PRCAT00002182001 [Priceomyces carsonii]|uniref:uncharacterized protein n=1 Tax=Priceomyces carsonii TaxID=28549 RepID=UPI002ED95A5F|nr:unnamed protein product [Priceomyces carsonii]